jgi:two-component system cell cycle sensor histidine kinase PleC
MDQGLSMVDGDLRAIFTNKKFYELLDMPPALGEGDADYERFIRFNAERGEYGPGDIEDLIRERVKLAKQFEAHCFERERPDGTVIEIRGNPLPEGGFVTIYTDITERRRHDEALREAVALQRNLLDHSPAIIAIRDLEGRFQLVNRAYEQLFEVDRSEIEGKLASDVMSEEFARRLADYDRHVIQSGESLTHEHDATFVDGPGTLLSVRFPVRNAAGALTGVGSIAVDVTERRRAELALNAAKEEAELANRAKTEFLANMSHELRTPLNAIIGFSQIIEQGLHGALPDKYRSYARDILESGQHLSDLLGDILDLSKIEAAKYELQEQPIDLREAADTCLRLVDERAKAAGLTLVSRIRRNVPALYGDQTALKQVLLNLLTNAIKFTPSGGSIALRAGKSRKGGLWLSVADTGLGMAPNDIKVALTAFGQVASHLTRNHEGSGLGLPLCKSLVELHGGTLEVESALDQGTTVTVRFPPERTLTASRRRQLPKAG